MDERSALEHGYARAEALIRTLDADTRRRPTPCPRWNAEELVQHLILSIDAFPTILSGRNPDWAAAPDRERLLEEFREARERNLAVWQHDEAVELPVPDLPGLRMIDLNLADAIVHTWDLAAGLGEQPELDEAAVALTLEIWSRAPMNMCRARGAFGPEVEVPEDAAVLDRLVALLGRDPAWTPEG